MSNNNVNNARQHRVNVTKLNMCLAAKAREIQRQNFIRRAAFILGRFACKWASIHAHGPFTAYIGSRDANGVERFVSVLVQPVNDGTPEWFYTEHVCPVAHGTHGTRNPEPRTQEPIATNDPAKNALADIYAGAYEVGIPDTRPEPRGTN